MHAEMLIAGHFVGGPCDQAVGKAVVRNPFGGRVVGTAAEGDEGALMTAIAAAHDAFPAWRRTPGRARAELLRRVAEAVRERRAELAELLVLEIGKPISLAEGEVDRLALTFGLAADLAPDFGQRELDFAHDPRGGEYSGAVQRFPLGVVLAIVPYNWPYNLTAHKVAPALASGNTVVVKPSPQALLSTYALGRLMHACGAPPGVVNFVEAPIPATQVALADTRVRMVSFTGSDAVGWKVKAGLPPETRCALELGGDAFAYVAADADLEWAAQRMAVGAFAYAGQICISLQHALVDAAVYDELVSLLKAATAATPFGDPARRETMSGPLISASAADRVEAWITEAVAGGATVLAGGVREGNVISPCLIADVPPTSRLATGEVFGPALTISRVDSADAAVARINASAYGLQASVFTRNPDIANYLYQEVDTGAVIVNDHPSVRFDSYPYGGVKRSGFGREGVEAAMLEMTDPKVNVARSTGLKTAKH